MKEWQHPFDRPPEAAFIILDDHGDVEKRERLFEWLEAVLPRFNWRTHLFLIEPDHRDGHAAAREMLRVASSFVERYGFATLYAHLSLHLSPWDSTQGVEWEQLIAPARQLQARAYELLTETRLHISPILSPSPEVSVEDALTVAGFFNSRLAVPTFYLHGGILEGLTDRVGEDEIRFFVDPGGKGLAAQLWMSHVTETVLERVEAEEDTLLLPCRRHLVVDEKTGGLFSCFKQWEEGGPSLFFDRDRLDEAEIPGAPIAVDCATCIGRSALSMRENLRANGRRREGHQICSKLTLAFASQGSHALAAGLARRAYEFSDSDADRAAALIHEGLCLREAGELAKAEEALKLASEYAEDRGLVAYHRGRVQFDWGDYIEALERFEEALASGSAQVPVEDMCFEMALSHVRIEEYGEARRYLERSLKPGEKKPPVSFYRGICDLAEGEVEKALEQFREALELGPAPEDLGRILFYIGTCFKEMGRFEEAIDPLRKAVAADPADILNHNLLGFCYYKLGRHEEAVPCFLRALEIDPRSAIDWASLGSNLRDLGRIDEAIKMYEKALSLDPTLDFARKNLVNLTRKQ